MRSTHYLLLILISVVFFTCGNGESMSSRAPTMDSPAREAEVPVPDVAVPDGALSLEEHSGEGQSNGQGPTSGQVTAGEWNDLYQWEFWRNLSQNQNFHHAMKVWNFNTAGRVSINLSDEYADPIRDARIELFSDDQLLYTARTNQDGRAELFTNLYGNNNIGANASLSVRINGQSIKAKIEKFSEGVNEIIGPSASVPNRAELAFLVDATGSMGDELEFLKKDLTNVLARIQQNSTAIDFDVATVFYRDVGDDYVTRHSGFGNSVDQTMNFIRKQYAAGGGDFPEAVHSALDVAVNNLQWSDRARARIAFLLLDAPPRQDKQTMDRYRTLTLRAAEKGIRIVPIVASGIDKPTEFLMRFTAIATNGTYVFITDDSGIGNDHLEPTVEDFEVEFLNDLLVRVVGEMIE